MAPLRRAWGEARAQAQDLLDKSEAKSETGRDKYTTPTIVKNRERAAAAVADFLGHLGAVTVLDPACGSGNFLYVTLQKMKDLEKEAVNWAADRGLQPPLPLVHPRQFYGIEVNPYAYELAQMTLWIGYLQWIRANGLGQPSDPVLESLQGNFLNMDAIVDTGSAVGIGRSGLLAARQMDNRWAGSASRRGQSSGADTPVREDETGGQECPPHGADP